MDWLSHGRIWRAIDSAIHRLPNRAVDIANVRKGKAVLSRAIRTSTLVVTPVCDGEVVVSGGDDAQTWIATFCSKAVAEMFVECMQAWLTVKVPEPTPRRFVAKGVDRG